VSDAAADADAAPGAAADAVSATVASAARPACRRVRRARRPVATATDARCQQQRTGYIDPATHRHVVQHGTCRSIRSGFHGKSRQWAPIQAITAIAEITLARQPRGAWGGG
jgi:hypothetical protein